jgi:hypothetical protein
VKADRGISIGRVRVVLCMIHAADRGGIATALSGSAES